MPDEIADFLLWENHPFLLDRMAFCARTVEEWIRLHGHYKASLMVLETHDWPEPSRSLMRTAIGR